MVDTNSTDATLAGFFARKVREEGRIGFKTVLELTQSKERAKRIFAQLERTGSCQIDRGTDQPYLVPNQGRSDPNTGEGQADRGKVAQLRSLLEIGPISTDEIAELMGVAGETAEQLLGVLLEEGTYGVRTSPSGTVVFKR